MSHRNMKPKPHARPRTWRRWVEAKHSSNRNPDRFKLRVNPYPDNDNNSKTGTGETPETL